MKTTSFQDRLDCFCPITSVRYRPVACKIQNQLQNLYFFDRELSFLSFRGRFTKNQKGSSIRTTETCKRALISTCLETFLSSILCPQNVFVVSLLLPETLEQSSSLSFCSHVLAFAVMQIKDVSTGKLLGPMEQGELLIKGPGITLGYLNNPKATEEAIVEDGWLRMGKTGDLQDAWRTGSFRS